MYVINAAKSISKYAFNTKYLIISRHKVVYIP